MCMYLRVSLKRFITNQKGNASKLRIFEGMLCFARLAVARSRTKDD